MEEEEAIAVGLGCLRFFSRIALLTGIATSACWSGSALQARAAKSFPSVALSLVRDSSPFLRVSIMVRARPKAEIQAVLSYRPTCSRLYASVDSRSSPADALPQASPGS